VKDLLNDFKYGKPYEHLRGVSERYPDEKFYKLQSISATRFAGYFFLVLKAILLDIKFIIVALEERALESRDEEAKRLLKSIANVKFLSLLSGMIDIYAVIAKLSAKLQTVNLFIWERRLAVKAAITTMKQMKTAFQSDDLHLDQNLWPQCHTYWPQLRSNTLVRDIPYLDQDNGRFYN
jgi:hypothetical protein